MHSDPNPLPEPRSDGSTYSPSLEMATDQMLSLEPLTEDPLTQTEDPQEDLPEILFSTNLQTLSGHLTTDHLENEESKEHVARASATTPEPPAHYAPAVPETIEDTGLAVTLIEQMILKMLYARGDTSGRELSRALGLKFSLIDDILEIFKRQHQISVKRSIGMGNMSAVFALSEAGRTKAREYMESSRYIGPAPVPLSQYSASVERQRLKGNWLTPETLAAAYKHMVVSPRILAQVGPAVNAGKSFLIYGQPGNGKTYLAEALFQLECPPVYIPYAIETQGSIVKMFDPLYHHRLVEEEREISALSSEPMHDGRWVQVKRPFIVTGGELALDMLDLNYDPVSKVHEAPFQLKANNGIYLIDDFGRQKVSPAEVLNRWIVPMERRIDYLSLQNGGKMQVPFETFLVFSTNLKPNQLGDEAFLRRIQYKMYLRSPDAQEFSNIFKQACGFNKLEWDADLISAFISRNYVKTGKRFRRCHPRDLLAHAVDLIGFERRPHELTDDVLKRAFESCFIESEEMDD